MLSDHQVRASDLTKTNVMAETLYDEWREFFDLPATWQDLNHEDRNGWRVVAVRAQLVARLWELEEEAT